MDGETGGETDDETGGEATDEVGEADLRGRIADQFSYRGERADVWRAFDLLLETDAFLNLGYSNWYQPHVLGSPQRRLATQVGRALARHLPATDGVRLLDVGCGRGGPAIHLADRFGFRVTGVDLVPYNVGRARANAGAAASDGGSGGNRSVNHDGQRRGDAAFVVGDATRLPFDDGAFRAATAVDALVYLPDRPAVFAAVSGALDPDGVLVLSDLVRKPVLDDADERRVDAFAEAWDMPPPGTVAGYERALAETGLRVAGVRDLTPHSVGRFRKWTTRYLALVESPAGALVERLLRRYGLAPSVIETQVRRVHEALPSVRHVLLVASR